MSYSQPLTKDVVRTGYILFLGREPESEEVIDRHIREAKTFSGLRDRLIESKEFQRKVFRPLSRLFLSDAPISSVESIETDGPHEILDRLFDHVQKIWSKLGNDEPHYSVLSSGRYKPDNIEANLADFYKSGDLEIDATLSRLGALRLSPTFGGSALELGCGVGRVTKSLAQYFNRVDAFDVSENHLKLASDYFLANKVTNVTVHKLKDLSGLSFPDHDFFYSRIVLQHNPPPIIKLILDRALSALRPGGIAAFQLITSKRDYTFEIQYYLDDMDQIVNQELHALPQAYIFSLLQKYGILPIEVYRDSSVNGPDVVSTSFIVLRPT